uniref:Transactivator/viroplasmin protein n=1 Tax=Blueberry red ringspot virus TaxID=172220 RepID=G4WV12_9VIRU|nr:translational transactivator [Blueberry red ringspot virus]
MEGAIKTLENQISTKEQSFQAKKQKLAELEAEINNLRSTLAILSGDSSKLSLSVPEEKKHSVLADIEEVNKQVALARSKKEYYVIFNGPMKGIYDEWHKAAPHIQGKANIIHKKYPTIDEAKKALGGSYAAITNAPASPKDSKVLLGRFKVPSVPTIDSIQTIESKMKALKVTQKKYNDYMEILYNYKDQHKLLHFYPKYRDTIGYKAIILPEASSLTTYELFKNGLADTIYFSDSRVFNDFPERIKQTINNYFKRFAKERPCYIKLFSTHPTFSIQGEEDMPSYAVLQIGISNGDMPLMDNHHMPVPKHEELKQINLQNFIGVINHLSNLTANIKMLYKSDTMIIYSKANKEIEPDQEAVFIEFEKNFIENKIPKMTGEMKKELCNHMTKEDHPGHYCQYCPFLQQDDKKSASSEDEEKITMEVEE